MEVRNEEMTAEQLWSKLTPKQRKFCAAYEKCGNGTNAAIAAGYKENSAAVQASRMLKNDKILAYLRAHAREELAALGLDRESIYLKTYEVFKRCMVAEPHLAWNSTERAYEPDGFWIFDAKNALKALDMLGGWMGLKNEDTGAIPGNTAEEDALSRSLREMGQELKSDDKS